MLIEQVTLSNLLSFGASPDPIPLGQLNLIIGPNGSGKSNFLEAIDLLRHAPSQLATPIRDAGGISDWLWKGAERTPTACINAVLANPKGPTGLRYVLSFTEIGQRFEIVDERIENDRPDVGQIAPYSYYHFERGRPVLNIAGKRRYLRREDIDLERSILAQRRDPDQYPEITYLADVLPKIRLYRDWAFGRYTAPRRPQKVDLPNDMMEPDGSNLGLVLNRLRRDPVTKARLLDALRRLYDGIDDFDVQIEGGTVQVFFHEGKTTIPATRLSDGTLRYLCLLAVLCHPNPPPLVCIEEPELGLHPDILPTIGELLRDASSRCQLIVTTHSDVLVDAMTDTPDAVLICEKENGATMLRRLSVPDVQVWLERYRLGELWTRGEIGGTRW
jgi:predicted ATPase